MTAKESSTFVSNAKELVDYIMLRVPPQDKVVVREAIRGIIFYSRDFEKINKGIIGDFIEETGLK